MRYRIFRSIEKALGLALATSLALGLGPGRALAGDFLGAGFEEFTGIPAEAAVPLSDDEMDDLRGGGGLEFFFSVVFSGFAETAGKVDITLDVFAGLAGQPTGSLHFEATDPDAVADLPPDFTGDPGPAVDVTDTTTGEIYRIQSVIGDGAFAGANMMGQISQVGGSLNNIAQIMNVNLAIINVATESDLPAVRNQLAPFFGF